MSSEARNALAIAFLVDLHWTPERELRLPPLGDIDLVVLGGDLTNFRGPTEAAEILARIRAAGPEVLAVCGNCDRPETEQLLEQEGIALDGRAVSYQGVRLLGLSGGLPFGGCPYERTEQEYERLCAELWVRAEATAGRPTILVSHQPPRGVACDLARGRHVGSQAIRTSIEQHRPELVLCGHIHEARSQDRLGDTVVVNPGPWFRGTWARVVVQGPELTVTLEPGEPESPAST